MINKAIAKITDEMMAAGDDMTRALEEHLTSICNNETVASKLLDPNKTLKEFVAKLWDLAKTRKKGNSAVILSDEVFPILEEYYGITDEDKQTKRSAAKTSVVDMSDFL